MEKFDLQLQTIYAGDRSEWRRWLEDNHQNSIGVWLIYYKVGSVKPSILYPEAVKEALCFGWIDSKVKSLDSDRYMQVFTPRKPKSVWSKLNKQYIQELIDLNLMTTAGMQKIETAKQDRSWITLDAIEELVIPTDLEQALAANDIAQKNFSAFNKSTKKSILFWIATAKRIETRLNRIAQTITAAEYNKNPLVK
jgi:uncharacterized protein YdeI (YjbR/CyaY-like superfamily)